MKNILVTGGAGFIGSHICTLLLQNNYKLTIVDSLINSSLGVIGKIKKLSLQNNKNSSNKLKFVRADLRDYKSIKNIFAEAEEKVGAEAHLHCLPHRVSPPARQVD